MKSGSEELRKITESVAALSRRIGHWMKEQVMDASHTEIKSPNNLVTYVDRESESRFVQGLKALLPEAGFVAEEGSGTRNDGGYNWVIDPLDGTTNFVHGVPVWCTSVGLTFNGIPVAGVIYDPNSEEMYTASSGNGAFMNGLPIRVSTRGTLKESLLATGFPYDDFGRESPYLLLFRELMHHTRGMRRLGSAALDMAWTANGRFEGFYEYGLNPWDVAAGTIIVREAGGTVTGFHEGGDPVFGEDLVCTNALIHNELGGIISRFFKG